MNSGDTKLALDAARWHVINDGVMGGGSRSEVLPLEPRLLFRGQISLANNGGFASIRCRFTNDFSGASGFRLAVRGDGRRYQFRLRADESPGSLTWRAEFATTGALQLIEVKREDFVPVFRGQVVKASGGLNTSDIHLLGFMLADRQPGPFRLEVHSIEALHLQAAPNLTPSEPPA